MSRFGNRCGSLFLTCCVLFSALNADAATYLQSIGYSDSGDGPTSIEFEPFDDQGGRRRLQQVDVGFRGDLSMDIIVENYDPVAYAESEWFVDIFQTVLFSFDSTADYPDGGPFFWIGGISKSEITGDLSAGTGGNPFEPGTPGDVTVTASESGSVDSTLQVSPESFDYFYSDQGMLQAKVGAFTETLFSLPPGASFLQATVTRAEQVGVLSLVYTFDIVGDLNDDEVLSVSDIDLLYQNIDGNVFTYDLNGDDTVDQLDVDYLVLDLMETLYGDSNGDMRFDSSDLVAVFEAGKYEDDIELNATWAEGDWNGDGEFDSSDFVFALERSGQFYEQPRAASAVPEPTVMGWPLVYLLLAIKRIKSSKAG